MKSNLTFTALPCAVAALLASTAHAATPIFLVECPSGEYAPSLEECPAVLSSLSITGIGSTSATVRFSALGASGLNYVCINSSESAPAAGDLVDCAGGSEFVDGSGPYAYLRGGLTPNTTLYAHVLNINSWGWRSNTLTASFQTAGGANALPEWSFPDQNFGFEEAVSLDLDAVTTDSDALTYSIVVGQLPTGLSLGGPRNKDLTGTTGTLFEQETVTFGATDGKAEVVSASAATQWAFNSIPFTRKSGTFDLTMDVTPADEALNLVIGLAPQEAEGFGDLCAIVRFGTTGVIQARDGDAYDADAAVTYEADQTYSITFGNVDVQSGTYDVLVGETTLASGYAFRGDCGAPDSLDHFVYVDDPITQNPTGSTIEDVEIPASVVEADVVFTVFEADETPPNAPDAPTVQSFTPSSITLALPESEATDHSHYEVHRSTDDSSYSLRADNVTTSTWTDTGLTAETAYYYKLADVDLSGNTSELGDSVSQETAAEGGDWHGFTKPTAENTGPTNPGIITPYTGPTNITTPGTTLENFSAGLLRIQANNVTLRNCIIDGNNSTSYGVQATYGATGLLVEHCEFRRQASAGFYGGGGIVRNSYFHDQVADGIKPTGNLTIQSNYFECMGNGTNPSAHADGIQMTGGSNVVIEGNNLALRKYPPVPGCKNSIGIIIQTHNPIDNVSVRYNWLNGGSYTQYFTDKGEGFGAPTNTQFIYNRIGIGYSVGPLTTDGDNPTDHYGNVWDESGTNTSPDVATGWAGPWVEGELLPGQDPAP